MTIQSLERKPTYLIYLDFLPYAALVGFVALTVLALGVGAAEPLQLAYPAAAVGAGVLLLWRKPALYTGFMWWLWFLTPEVRRLVDFEAGWTTSSPIMLTPFLVTGLALLTVAVNLYKLPKHYWLPYALAFFGLLYSYGVGLLMNGVVGATFDLLNWLVPVASSVYVLVYIPLFPKLLRVVQGAFLWGVLVMGVYGLIQFFFMPAWDAYWMQSAPISTIGLPFPYEVRVFSTLNASGPFAIVMMVGLLLLLGTEGVLRWPVFVMGLASFLLSLVRSAWGGWILGLLFFAFELPNRLRLQLLAALVVVGVIAFPVLSTGPLAETIGTRFDSLRNIQNDMSFRARFALYADSANYIFDNPLGQGLGSTGVATKLQSTDPALLNLDSGILAILYTMGLLGSAYYGFGMFLLLLIAMRIPRKTLFEKAFWSIIIAALSQIVFGNNMVGVAGMTFWFFLGFYLCAYEHRTASEAVTAPVSPPQHSFSGRVYG